MRRKKKAKEIVGKNLAGFIDQVTKNYEWKVPKHITKKPSELPAIDIPLPGSSYNPTYDAHQELLQKALNVEIEKEKKEKKLFNQLAVKFADGVEAPTKVSWLKEMSSGLFDENWENVDETAPFNTSSVSVGKPVSVNTKTTHKRNQEKERRNKDYKRKQMKEKNVREHSLFRLKSIKKELDENERKFAEKQSKRRLQKNIG